MQLNGIDLIGYDHTRDTLTAVLDTDYATILPLDGQELKVTEGESDIAVFGGYHLTGMELMDNEYIRATFVIKIEPNIEQAIESINKNIEIHKSLIEQANQNNNLTEKKADSAQTSADNAQSSADIANNGVATLTDDVDIYGGAIEELGSTAADNAISIEDLTSTTETHETSIQDLIETEEANSAAIEEMALQLFKE